MISILVPTDFSSCSLNAIKYAIQFVQQETDKLIFFNSSIYDGPPNLSAVAHLQALDAHKASTELRLKRYIDSAFRSLRLKQEHFRTELIVEAGDSIVNNILNTATERSCSYIIMGTLGASGIKRLIFGSNTVSVFKKAIIPVIAVPEHYKFIAIERISFAAATTTNLAVQIKKILPIAKRFKAMVDILHIIDAGLSTKKLEGLRLNLVLEELQSTLRYYLLNFYILDRSDETVEQGINRFTEHQRSQLLVMLNNKRGFIENIYKPSKTENIANELKIPLMVIKQE